ncbi:MAG: (d)CMP kinase [Hahellaceae bacterium]|nr:(d)CMP kinase [Hahellaceae bacterium]
MVPVITIDGPSGVGKGSIAQMLARQLGWHLLDSGALYRLTALSALRQGLDLADADAVATAARDLPVTFTAGEPGEPVAVLLSGEDVTREIRTEACGKAASTVAVYPLVRQALLQRQRDFQRLPGLVADGRDMGTVIFPEALCKVYMTASAEVRAQRRYDQLKRQGESVKISHLLKEIQDRDARDMGRVEAPLRPAEDAVIIDTSSLTLDEVLAAVLKVWSEKQA